MALACAGARRAVVTLVIGAMLTTAGLAQSTPAPQASDPKACSEEQRLRLEGDHATRDPSQQNLGDKLAQTEGVICPPAVDPGIKAPTPDVGKMPVMPPPGSPGGDPHMRPK